MRNALVHTSPNAATSWSSTRAIARGLAVPFALVAAVALFATGCGTVTNGAHAESASAESTSHSEAELVEHGPKRELTAAEKKVMILAGTDVGRPSYIVEVFDFHTSETDQDKGFDQLRVKAAAMGADAVIGVEFEHGDEGGVSHLSGMAVKFDPEPVHKYVALAQLDVESDEDSTDKGLAKMVEQAKRLGADEIVDVTFEHGDDGQKGHLRGTAVKWTDKKVS